MDHQTLVLTILNGGAALLGIYFLLRATRAYRSHRSRHLFVLAVAVAFLTLGILAEGFAVQILGWPLSSAHVVEASISLVGFGILVYSLYA